MKVTTYKTKRVAVKDTEIFIPEKPFYCFQTGIRRSIRIIPVLVTWDNDPKRKNGDIFALEITCVYRSFECIAEKFNLVLSDIERHLNYDCSDKASSISKMLLNEDYSVRTEEDFNTDLEFVLNELKK